ncbi:MAG: hypothetical protein ACI92E_001651 [Oceanicoccus sp.]|jgi:uncharacterized protein (DUF342 family)
MVEAEESSDGSANHGKFLAIDLVYDQKTNFLSAVLTDSETDLGINWASLQQLIVDKDFASFMVPNKILEDLLRQIQSGKGGIVPLVEKPVFIGLSFVVDDEAKALDAVLSETDVNLNLSSGSLQALVKESNLEAYNVTGTVLQGLLKRVENKETGVFRIGELPEYTVVSFGFDEDEIVLVADLSQSYVNPLLTLDSLKALIGDGGYETLFFEDSSLENLLGKINDNQRGSFPVARKLDATVVFEVAADKMSAAISTFAAYGGKWLTEDVFDEAFLDSKLEANFCDMSIRERALSGEILNKTALSKGTPPVDGIDGSLTPLVDEMVYFAPKVNDKGVADLLEVNDFTVVDIGTSLMRKTPATAGKDGRDVFGEIVPATEGKEILFAEQLEGAEIDPSDEHLLLAARKGHPLVKKNSVVIDSTLHVNNVNTRIGNINFDGSLLVDGDVTAGVDVEVSGSIIIKGVVTHAAIRAGGEVIINGGVMGEVSEANDSTGDSAFGDGLSTHISAVGGIKAQYLSLTSVESQKEIEIAEYCSHCTVRTQGKLLLGQSRGKGRLMGGTYYAKDGVFARVLGTDANIKTYVSAGFTKELQEKNDDLLAAIRSKVGQSNKLAVMLQDIIAVGKKSALPPQKIEKAKKLRIAVIAIRAEIDEMKAKVTELRSVFKESEQVAIEVGSTLYPNVSISVNAVDFVVRKESKGGKFTRSGNDIRWE